MKYCKFITVSAVCLMFLQVAGYAEIVLPPVLSDKVSKPVAVRYAWAGGQLSWANLFNKDGLPALPFKADGQ